MSDNTGSIWDDETWEVECPPSVPMDLWEQVPEKYRREFIIEAAFALRRGVHPCDTFEEMLEEKGIQRRVVETPVEVVFEEDEEIRPSGRMSFVKRKPAVAEQTLATGGVPLAAPQSSVASLQNKAAAKLWPGKPVSQSGSFSAGPSGGLPSRGFSTTPHQAPTQKSNMSNFGNLPSRGFASNEKQRIIVKDIGDTF